MAPGAALTGGALTMGRAVAFLRAINVGGHTVKSAQFVRLFEALGCTDVKPFLASGNVRFSAPRAAAAALERRIATHLERELGYSVATFVRTPEELQRLIAQPAFTDVPRGSMLFVGFHAQPLAAGAKRALAALANDVDTFHPRGRELLWWCTRTSSTATVTTAQLEKVCGQPVTFRRSTTVEKLVALG